jgi:hypothetical protein
MSFLQGLYGLLINAGPVVALGCVLAAALSLRGEGGMNFHIGGGFARWMLWAIIFLSLPTIPKLLSVLGVPNITQAQAGTSSYMTGLQGVVSTFVTDYLVGKFAAAVAGFLVLKALLDSNEGKTPLPSLISAIFVLSVQGTWTLAKGWVGTDAYGVTTGLNGMLNYFGGSVCPIAAVLCFIGAVVCYIKGQKWGQLVLTAIGMLTFSGLWALVKSWA